MPCRIIKPNKQELTQFMLNGTNKSAAKHFGVSVRTIVRLIKKYNLSYYNLKYPDNPSVLNENQQDIVVASMLGDGSITKHGQFHFGQCAKHSAYIEHIQLQLFPFSKPLVEATCKLKGKFYKKKYFVTMNCPIFKKYRQIWYSDKQKIIPNDLKLNKNIIAHWFVQDGCNHWQRKEIVFSTESFKYQECEFLSNLLGFEAKPRKHEKHYVITIGAKNYFDFIDFVKPLITWNCFSHKINTHNLKRGVPYKHPKPNKDKAEKIRNMFWIQKIPARELASKYNLSIQTIYNIINNKSYKSADALCSGTAIVSVI